MNLYDKTLGLEVDPIGDLKYSNPNIVKEPSEFGKLKINNYKNQWRTDPTMQENVGEFFNNQDVNDKYLNRENITSGDLPDLNEVQSRNQTTGEAWRNGFISRALSIVPKVLNMPGVVGGFAATVGDYLSDSLDPDKTSNWAKSLDHTYNNFWVNAMQSIDTGLRDAMPVYGSKNSYGSPSLIKNMGSAKFWAEDMLDGLAFTASAMIPGAGIAKGLQALELAGKVSGMFKGATVLANLGKTAEALTEAEKAAKGVDFLTEAITTGVNTINESALEAYGAVKGLDENASKKTILKNDPVLNKAATRIGQLQKQYESLPDELPFTTSEGIVIPTKKMLLSKQIEDETSALENDLNNKWKEHKGQVGLHVFNWNNVALIAPDYLQAKLFTKSFGQAERAIARSIADGGEKAIKGSVLKAAAKQFGIGTLREGFWEENVQQGIQEYYASQLYNKRRIDNDDIGLVDGLLKFGEDDIAGIAGVMKQDVVDLLEGRGTDGAKSVFLGAASGGMTSSIFGMQQQFHDNKNAKLEATKWDQTKKWSNLATSAFFDGYRNILDKDGNISMENMIKTLTYTNQNKSSIDKDQMALLTGNNVVGSLLKNDELAKRFYQQIVGLNEGKFNSQEEAVEVLKKNIEQLKTGENVDEDTIKNVDFFLSKIDKLSENWTKANKQIDSLIDDKHENSSNYKGLLAKTLFFGMNKLNEIDSILKENEGKFSKKQVQSFENMKSSISDSMELFKTQESLKDMSDEFHRSANLSTDFRNKALEQLKKPEAERDNNLINNLIYQADEIDEISGGYNGSLTYGFDSFKMSLSPTDVINRKNLGLRDRYFYDIGMDAISKNRLNDLLKNKDSSIEDIVSFVKSEAMQYINESDKNRIKKSLGVKLKQIEDISEAQKDLNEAMINAGLEFDKADSIVKSKNIKPSDEYEAKSREEQKEYLDFINSLNDEINNSGDRLEQSMKLVDEVDKVYSDRERERTEYLGAEENAHNDSFVTNLRKRIANDYLRKTQALSKNISEDDSFSNSELLNKLIKDLDKRISVFTNGEFHKDLIGGYLDSLNKLKEELESYKTKTELNKNNKAALDERVKRDNNNSHMNALGLSLNGTKVSIMDKSLTDAIKSIVGDALWNELISGLETDGKLGDSIFVDRFIAKLSEEDKVKVITVIDSSNNTVKDELNNIFNSYVQNNVNKPKEKLVQKNYLSSFLDNPERCLFGLFSRLKSDGKIILKVSTEKSTNNKKSILDKFLVDNNLELFLENVELDTTELNDSDRQLIRGLLEKLIKVRNSAIISESLSTSSNMKNFVETEDKLAKENQGGIAPSNQQRDILKRIFKWFGLNDVDKDNGYSSILLCNGIAGTGKTTVIAKLLFKILARTNNIDVNKNVTVVGSNKNIAESLAKNISKKSDFGVYSFEEFVLSTISSDSKIIVFDEIGTLDLSDINRLKEKIEDINKNRDQKNLIKVLGLGDPNQVRDTTSDIKSFFVEQIPDSSFESSKIKSLPSLIVQYRSDIDAINDAADAFSGRATYPQFVIAKSNTELDSSKENPRGVHAVKSLEQFTKRISIALKGNRDGGRVTIGYNTESELASLKSAISAEDQVKCDFKHFTEIQGSTLDQIFIYVLKGGVINPVQGGVAEVVKSRYNAIMYMLLSRPKEYVCVYNEDNTFTQEVDSFSMESKTTQNVEQMLKAKEQYTNVVSSESAIMGNKKTTTKKTTTPKEETVEPVIVPTEVTKDDEDFEQKDFEDEEEDATKEIEKIEKLESEINKKAEEAEAKQREESKKELISDDELNPNAEHISIENTTSDTIKSSGIKAGDELTVNKMTSKGKTIWGLFAKVGSVYHHVASLSTKEALTLGLQESDFEKGSVIQNADGIYKSKDVENTFALKDGNQIKMVVSKDPTTLTIKYDQGSPMSGSGFISDVIASMAVAFNKVKNSSTVQMFLPTIKNMGPGQEHADLPLRLGVPYLIVKFPGLKKMYVRLEPKVFNSKSSWSTFSGKNAYNVLKSFTDGVESIENWFSNNGIATKFGDLDFGVLINLIAQSKYIAKNGDNTISFVNQDEDSFEKLLIDSPITQRIADMFGNDIDKFKQFIKENEQSIEDIIDSHYKVEDKVSEVKLDEATEDEYSFSDSLDNFDSKITQLASSFNSILNGITIESVNEDFVKDQFGITNADDIAEFIKIFKKINIDNAFRLTNLCSEAFRNNKLFSKGASENIDSSNKTDVRNVRELFKIILKDNRILGVQNTTQYEWLPEIEDGKDRNGKTKYKHHVVVARNVNEANVRDVKKDIVVTSKKIGHRHSDIQSILNNIVLANKSINNKNFRSNRTLAEIKNGSSNKTKKSVSIMNTETDFFVDKNAEAFDKTINRSSDEKVAENLDAVRTNSESYTYRLADLKYMLDEDNKLRRNIDANEVSEANKSGNFDMMEDLTTTNFNGVTKTSLTVTNGKSKLESKEEVKHEVQEVEKPIDEVADIDDLLLEKDIESEQLVGREVKVNSALEYLRRLFPTESEDMFRFLEAVRSGDKSVFGRFVNGIIEVEKASSDTVYENIVRHEAFHKVWNEFLTQEQRNSIVEAYLNTLTEQQEKEQGLFGLPLEQLSKILEEKIARKYQAYNKNQDKNYGFMQKSLLFLKDIFSRLKTMLTGHKSDIEHYFNLIDGGYFNKQFDNFRGTRGYYGIQEDFKSVDSYIIAKQKVAEIFAHISSVGRNGSFIPFSETEINDSLLATMKSLLAKTESIVSKMDSENLSEQDKVLYDKYVKNIEAYQSLLKTKNGTKFPVLVKMLDEVLPGRGENSIIDTHGEVVTDGNELNMEDIDEESDVKTENSEGTVLSPFAVNSNEVNQETKLFAKIKHFLMTIKNLNGDFVNNRYAFIRVFQLMEGLNNDLDSNSKLNIMDQIAAILSKSITKSKTLNAVELESQYGNRSDVAIFLKLKEIYELASSINYPSFMSKSNKELVNVPIRNDIKVFLDKNGDISTIAYSKNGSEIKENLLIDIENNKKISVIEKLNGESQKDFAERVFKSTFGYEENSNIVEMAAIMHRELARNKWTEIQNTFNSLKEERLKIVKNKNDNNNMTISSTDGQSSSKNTTLVGALKKKISSKFKTIDEFKNFVTKDKRFGNPEVYDSIKNDPDKIKEYCFDFLKKIGITNVSKASGSDIKYTDLMNNIYHFMRTNALMAIEKIESSNKISEFNDSSNLLDDELRMSDEYVEDLFEDEGGILESISDLVNPEDNQSVSSTYRDAKGKRLYMTVPTSFASKVFKQLGMMKLFSKFINLPQYLSTDFMKDNIIRKGLQEIYTFRMHSGILNTSKYTDDSVVEYDGEGFSQFILRTFLADFLSNFKKSKKNGEYTYEQPVYVKSNRKDSQSAKVNVLSSNNILETIFPTIFNQMMKQNISDESKWEDYSVDSFVNMKRLENALRDVLGENYKNIFKEMLSKKQSFSDFTAEQQSAIKEHLRNQFEEESKLVAKKIVNENIQFDAKTKDIIKNLLMFEGMSEADAKEIIKDLSENQSKNNNAKTGNIGVYSNKPEMFEKSIELFLMNNYVNSYAVTQLVTSNNNFFKNGTSLLKRMSVVFGPGLSPTVGNLGMRTTAKVLVIDDVNYKPADRALMMKSAGFNQSDIDAVLEKGGDGITEYADGQGFITPKRHAELTRGYGTSYKLSTVGKPLWYTIDDNGVPHAVKYSWVVLTDQLIKDNPQLANLRANMDAHDIGESVFKSAVKVGIPKGTHSWEEATSSGLKVNDSSTMTLKNADYRLQLNPAHDFGENHVSIPTQLMYMLNIFHGNEERAMKAYDAYNNIIKLGLSTLMESLSNEGTLSESKISKMVLKKLRGSKSAEVEAEMFATGISQDFPTLSNKIVSQIASLFSKNTISTKFMGGKTVLQAAVGVKNREGKELSYSTETINGKRHTISEALITRDMAQKTLPKEVFDYLDEFFSNPENNGKSPEVAIVGGDMLGFRIPSSEIHSAVALKIEGWFEGTGNSIIVPKYIVEIHGSDFDVDSLFIIGREFIKDKDGNVLNYKKVDGKWSFNHLSQDEVDGLSYGDKMKYFKSIITDSILEATIDTTNTVRMQSPITTKQLSDVRQEIYDETGTKATKKDLDNSDFMESFEAHQSSHNGSAGTGIAASAFKTIAYAIRAGENNEIPTVTTTGQQLIIDGKLVDKLSNKLELYEWLDALVNAAIDNVKLQVLPFFNLNSNTFSIFIGMMAMDGVGLKYAARMSRQLFFKQIADYKSPTSRDFGFKQTNMLIEEFRQLVGDDKLSEADRTAYEDLTLQELKDSLKFAVDNNLSSLSEYAADLRSGKIKLSDEHKAYINSQIKFMEYLKTFKKIGGDLTSLSGYLSIIRDMPTTQLEIERKLEVENEIFEKDDDGNMVSKENFSIGLKNLFQSAPHIKSASEVLHQLNDVNKMYIFKHGPIVESLIDSIKSSPEAINESLKPDSELEDSEKSNSSSIKGGKDSEISMRDEIIRFLMNCINWDPNFKGYDSIPDARIKVNNKEIKVSGVDAFKKNFGKKVEAIMSYLESNDIQNRFMKELVGTVMTNTIVDWKMPRSVEFKSDDIIQLKAEFDKLSQYDVVFEDGKYKVVLSDNLDYKEWQKDFVRYGISVNGMSFGATNFSMVLPDALYKPVSDGLKFLIEQIKFDSTVLMKNKLNFFYQYIMNNPEVIKLAYLKKVTSKGKYSGFAEINGQTHFYDMQLESKSEDDKFNLLIRQVNNKGKSFIYKLIGVNGSSLYYVKLGAENPSNFYNMSEDLFFSASGDFYINTKIPSLAVINSNDKEFKLEGKDGKENDLLSMLKAKYDKNPFIIAVHNYTDVMRTGSKEVVVEIKGNKLVVVDEKTYKTTIEEEVTEVVDNSFEVNKDDILNKFAEETQESWDAKSEEIKSELIKQIKEGC